MTLSPAAARRVFLALSFTRWFPVGLIVGILTLWQLERGLTIAQAALTSSIGAIVGVLLELPTSSFADAFGRRPVYLAAALFFVAGNVALLVAQSFTGFVVAAVLTSIFRALDSGPLEAWFVDTVHETAPGADVDGALSAQGGIVGGGIAVGALVSGALIWWHPLTGSSALWLPVACYVVLAVVHAAAVAALLREPARTSDTGALGWARARESVCAAPGVVREGLLLVRHGRVLRALMLAEVTWSVAMVVFEMFQPVRLAELLGSESAAGAWMGPIAAGGWAVFGLGSALAGWTSGRIGVARAAILGRALNGIGAVVMGLAAGPVALVAAYAFTYSMHGFAGPMHGALLHREAQASNRATVMSLNSMMTLGAYAVGAPLLGLLAEQAGTPGAMVVGGIVGVLGVFCYLPARRAERATERVTPDGSTTAQHANTPGNTQRGQ